MNLKQLNYFVTVAEELHFGRAALRLHISQPPLSMSIQQLENNLGFTLFNRNNKNVALTDAGRLFYQEALMLLRHAEDMQQIGTRVAMGTLGQLRIGFTSSMLFRGLGQFIHQFQDKYPHVQVRLKEMNSSEQAQALKQELIHLGFVHSLNQEETIQHRLLLSEEFICCMPKHHSLAQQKVLDLNQLKHDNFVLFPRSVAPHYYDQITAMCVNAGFSPHISYEIRNWLTIIELVEAGLGVALVPSSMKSLNKANVNFVNIKKNHIRSETFCIWKENSSSVPLQHFLNELPFEK